MPPIKNVALAGVSGVQVVSIYADQSFGSGRWQSQASLIQSTIQCRPGFNFTVLTRNTSPPTRKSTVKTVGVDYTSLPSLTSAL